MEDFKSINLSAHLSESLERMKFITPTPIQAKSIPHALEGKDILGSANTGTGKTIAFGIPAIEHLLSKSDSNVLIMTPTRELALQVFRQLQELLRGHKKVPSVLLIGGESITKQLYHLRKRPRLIVGTPGRINDHLDRETLKLHKTDFLVLDETDRMLDMGFAVQIDKILNFIPQQRQTLLFSATLAPQIIKLTHKYLSDPIRISIDSKSVTPAKIKQEVIRLQETDKYEELLAQLTKREGSIIVFMKTKHSVEKMHAKLMKEDFKVCAIHGDLRQNKRDRVISGFRMKKYKILVATDVVARGLDIPHIEHVINYNLPQAPEDYIHRIGRTARAGAEGEALCFVTPSERGKWSAIDRLMNPDAAKKEDDKKSHSKKQNFKKEI